MANSDKPFGLRPVRHLDGSPYNGATEQRVFLAATGTAVGIGSIVKSNSSGGTGDQDGMADIALAGVTDTILGVVVSFDVDGDDLTNQYRLASTLRVANVCVSPDVIYEIQEDSDGGALAVTQIGNNFDTTAETVDTTSGRSIIELDSSDSSGTSTAQLRVLGKAKKPGNDVGTNCVWEVLINEHEYKSTTGT